MKKITAILFVMFIMLIYTLPAFATTGCEEHIVNYPATPAYTHDAGIEIYLCDVCGYEMWHCEECDQYMPIDEISCRNCEHVRVAINSQEQAKINEDIKNKKEVKTFIIGFYTFVAVCAIGGAIYSYRNRW